MIKLIFLSTIYGTALLGSSYLTFTGAWLPAPNKGKERISLREASARGQGTRRTHFYGGYLRGK